MPPEHRQLRAPCPKASGNAFQALMDPPHDGNSLSFDGGDERTDGSNDNTVVMANPCNSELLASQQLPHIEHLQTITNTVRDSTTILKQLVDSYDRNDLYMHQLNWQLMAISDGETMAYEDDRALSDDYFKVLESRMDSLLHKMDVTWTENTVLCEAYCTSREETAMLKAAVDTLTKKLNENIAISTPPSPGTMTSPTAMEEMTMHLSHIQNDIQDVLDTVRNPPGKRKSCTSGQDNEPRMPMNGQPTTQQHHDALLEHSLMHTCHATCATQEVLDALMIKYPLRQLANASTFAKPVPSPVGPETQDIPLPDTPATAPVETDGWKTVD
jgi:hypothetical protein